MNKKIIGAVVFVVLLVGVVGFVKRNTVLTTPLPPHVAGETPPPFIPLSPAVKFEESDIAKWHNVYRNEKYGFEIKYPDGWRVKTEDFNGSAFVSFDPQNVNRDSAVEIMLGERSMKERLDGLRTRDKDYKIFPDKKMIVNGISMTQIAILSTRDKWTSFSSVFTNNDNSYSYHLRGWKSPKKENGNRYYNYAVYNAMVSTFRFLE